MALDDLIRLVGKLRQRAQQHKQTLSKNEALTRYALIDPVLRALGWDTEDPDQVRPEYSPGQGAGDYALFENGKILAFIEAKALGQPLLQGVTQAINYSIQQGTPYFIITDGLKWEIYETHKPVPLLEKRLTSFDLTMGEAKSAVLGLLALWRPGLVTPQTLAVGVVPLKSPEPNLEPKSQARLTTVSSQLSSNGIALVALQATSGKSPPSRLVDPNGNDQPLKYWKDVLKLVTEWLVVRGYLTLNHCPIKVPQGSQYIVNSQPKHSDGHDFYAAVQVGPVWLETNFSADKCVQHARDILKAVGQANASFTLVP